MCATRLLGAPFRLFYWGLALGGHLPLGRRHRLRFVPTIWAFPAHTARRTFCTLQEKAGVPRSIIMRISGHRTEKDYLRYIGITFEYNADALRSANPQWFELKKKA
jgi:integrase